MKNLFLILALIFTQALIYGQSIFDQLEEMDDVTSVILNKEAFKILSKFDQKFNMKSLKSIRTHIIQLLEHKHIVYIYIRFFTSILIIIRTGLKLKSVLLG